MKKGDRVEFTHNGNTEYGVVYSGGTKRTTPTVLLDGAKSSVSGPASAFKLSNHLLPKDEPSVMDKWGITSHKDTGMGQETSQFSAVITLNGKPVLRVMNSGTGGNNHYHPVEPNGYTDENKRNYQALMSDAKEWGKQFGCPFDFEVEDIWVEWAAEYKPYGVLAVDYFREWAGRV